MLEAKRIHKPWIVDGQKIQEVVHGTILEAIQTAAQIMMLESEWPQKGNYVTTAKITREDLEFTLTLGTPDKPRQ